MKKNFKSKSIFALVLAIVLIFSFATPVIADAYTKLLNAEFVGVKLLINGKSVTPKNADGDEVEPFIVDGTTYLPIRAVAGAFGKSVDWDNTTNTVILSDPEITVLGLTPVSKDGDFAGFVSLLAKLSGADLSAFSGAATGANVAAAANAAAGNTELAVALGARGDKNAAITAAAAAGLLPESYENAAFTAAELNETAFRVAGSLGLMRGYVGSISDADILAKLDSTWNTIPEVLNDELKTIGGGMIEAGLITGFNIHNSAYSVAFDADRTLLYSHSSLQHVKQLIALIKSEGINARVALDPKTSWYVWDDSLNYGQEYDIRFEFASAADKTKIDGLVKEYAQKFADSDYDTLLSGSWWTPLYASAVPVDSNYTELVNNKIFFNGTSYYITTYGLKDETSDAVIAAFEELGATGQQSPLFVNNDFYDYIVKNLEEAAA